MTPKPNIIKLSLSILITLIAFAANSVLCRLALKENEIGISDIDPASFTSLRIISGAIFLGFIIWIQSKKTQSSSLQTKTKPKWQASIFLFIYAATLSYGYISQDTGVGALILFGCVQLTMISISFIKGKKLKKLEWIGISMAFLGLVYLIYPDLSSPSLTGAILMSLSGFAWALYTVSGMGSKNPLSDTAVNFIRASIYAALLGLISILFLEIKMSANGFLLAIASGVLASGAGYTLWYSVLKHINVSQASVLQLSVPILAAIGGVLFSSEPFTLRFLIASLVILGGIYLVLSSNKKPS